MQLDHVRHGKEARAIQRRALMVGVQPLSVRAVMERALELAGVSADRIEELDRKIRLVTSFAIDDLSPLEAAKDVRVPSFIYQAGTTG